MSFALTFPYRHRHDYYELGEGPSEVLKLMQAAYTEWNPANRLFSCNATHPAPIGRGGQGRRPHLPLSDILAPVPWGRIRDLVVLHPGYDNPPETRCRTVV